MIRATISVGAARRFYDRVGATLDWAEPFESRAKASALARLDLAAGQRVLNVGVGTGKDHRALRTAVSPGGTAVGVDISPRMLRLARRRAGSPMCQGDARQLPFRAGSFDRLLCTYVLDLIAANDLHVVLAEFRRVLKSGGRLALATLTEGVTRSSRIWILAWKALYALSPLACGGCRPLQLADLVRDSGFGAVQREIVVQRAVPSEVTIATR